MGQLAPSFATKTVLGNSTLSTAKTKETVRHIIAKLLITINPGILPSSQKLGAIPPLLALLEDIHSSSSNLLPKFEALLALTNLASDENSQDKIGKSIKVIHYQIFTDNLKIRQAAIECIANICCTKYVYTYFTGYEWGKSNEATAIPPKKRENAAENLKLWCIISLDTDEIDISRAALGGLAMCTSVFDEVCVELTKLDIETHKQ